MLLRNGRRPWTGAELRNSAVALERHMRRIEDISLGLAHLSASCVAPMKSEFHDFLNNSTFGAVLSSSQHGSQQTFGTVLSSSQHVSQQTVGAVLSSSQYVSQQRGNVIFIPTCCAVL